MVPLQWGVGEIGVFVEFWELGEGSKGREGTPHMGYYLPIKMLCAPIMLCGTVWGSGQLGRGEGLCCATRAVVMGCPVIPHAICLEVDIFLGFYSGWIINMNEHGFFYVTGDSSLWLPIHYSEAFEAYWVSCWVTVVVYVG